MGERILGEYQWPSLGAKRCQHYGGILSGRQDLPGKLSLSDQEPRVIMVHAVDDWNAVELARGDGHLQRTEKDGSVDHRSDDRSERDDRSGVALMRPNLPHTS